MIRQLTADEAAYYDLWLGGSKMTNRDKFREVFGVEIDPTLPDCVGIKCPLTHEESENIHAECKNYKCNGFWNKEYKGC